METEVVKPDHTKFSDCYKKYYAGLVKFLNGLVGNFDIAEDLAQETFTKLYEKNISIRPDSPTVKSFLFTCARNKAFDFMKQQRVADSKYREIYFEEIAFEKKFFDDLEDCVIGGEVMSTMHDVIDSLPQRNREIIEQKFFAKAKDVDMLRKMKTSRYMIKKIEREFADKIRCNLGAFFENNKAGFGYP